MPFTSESRIIAAKPAEVWGAITDLEQAPLWNRNWRRVEYLSEQRRGSGTRFRAHTEDGLAHDFRISDWADEEFVTFVPVRPEEEARYLLTLQSQSFKLRPLGEEGTDVILSAEAQGHGLRGWLAARFVWPSYQRQGLRTALDSLQGLFEPTDEDEREGAGEEEDDDGEEQGAGSP